MHTRTPFPALAIALTLLCCCTPALPARAQDDPPAPPRKISLDLDPNVLVFTEPLREDGTIDYLAALNKQLSEGVTKENNAFRPLYLAYPRNLGWTVEDDYFQNLDTYLEIQPAELKNTKEYQSPHSYAKRRGFDLNAWLDLLEERTAGPFADDDGQKIVAWLKVNDPVFRSVILGIKRPRYWRPLAVNSGLLIESAGFDGSPEREICRGLRYRANYFASIGNSEQAIQSLMAIVRIAELQSMDHGLLPILKGYSFSRIAGDCLDELLESSRFDSDSLKVLSEKWQQHKPPLLVAARFENDMRSLVQDSMMQIAAGRETAQHAIFELRGVREQDYFYDTVFKAESFDLDFGLSLAATYFKERADMLRASPYAKYDKINRKWEQIDRQAWLYAAKELLTEVDGKPRLRRGVSGKEMTAYATTLMLNYLDNGHAAKKVEYGWHAKHALLDTAIAIERYRLKHDKLPATVDALAPDFFAAVPIDPFNGKPIRYLAKDTGFAVYAVGENLKNDDGLDDPREGDVVVEINWLDD